MANKNQLKVFIKSLVGLAVTASIVFIFLIVQKLQAKKEIASSYAELPALELKGLDTTSFLLNKEYRGEKVLLIVYSSECPFCMEEIDEILGDHFKFANTSIVMTTMERRQSILHLSEQYSASDIPNLTLTYSDDPETINWMANFKVPSIFIYDEDHKLVKFFEGKTSVSKILEYI